MRSYKNFSYSLAILVLASVLCGPQARAAGASFGVQVRVVRHGAVAAPLDVPTPPGATRLTASPTLESYLFAGDSQAAGAFFRRAMVERNYRQVLTGNDDTLLTWERNGQRIRIRMDAVLGVQHATRILVSSET